MNKKISLLTAFFFIMILSISVLFLSSCGSKSSTLETVHQKSRQVTLPDFMAFTNNNAYQYSPKKESTAIHIMYNIDKEPGVITEYVNLIRNNYNFQIIAVDDKKNVDGLNTYKCEYGFVCNDTNSVKQFSTEINKKSENLHVYILVYAFEDMNWLVEIKYGEGINYVDTGDRTTHKLKNINYESEPKKEETKPQLPQREPTRKTTETKPTTSTPKPNIVETSAEVPSFSRIAPQSRFKFTGKNKTNSDGDLYEYHYQDSGNYYDDGWYKDSSGVAEKFVNLLVTKYPFKLYGHFTDDKTKELVIREEGTGTVMYPGATYYKESWTLDYTGSKNVKKHWIYGENLSKIYGHVHVIRRDYLHAKENNEIEEIREYTISISDGLTYEDFKN